MSALGNLFNLKHQLVVYGAHHNNKVNVIIHIICVPIIFWTGMLNESRSRGLIVAVKDVRLPLSLFLFSYTKAIETTFTALVFASNTGPLLDVSTLPSSLQWLKLFGPDLGFFAAVFYSVYYLFLDPATAVSALMQKTRCLYIESRREEGKRKIAIGIPAPKKRIEFF